MKSMSSTDDQLMLLIAKSDHDAFTELFDRHGDYVFGYAMRLLGGDRMRAEDISQSVWMKVIEAAPNYKPQDSFTSWVGMITRNTTFNHFRSTSRRREVAVEDTEDLMSLAVEPDFENRLLQRLELEHLQASIDSLPEQQRIVLSIWVAEDLDYQQIAETLGLTVPSVKSVLFRARKNISDAMKGIK